MSDQISSLPTEFVFPKEIKNISLEISSSDVENFSKNARCLIFQNCSFHRAAISRVCFAANRYLCSEVFEFSTNSTNY